MGKNRGTRKKIRSIRSRLLEHQAKLNDELLKESPDEGYIAHWKTEIKAWQNQIAKLQRRLEK